MLNGEQYLTYYFLTRMSNMFEYNLVIQLFKAGHPAAPGAAARPAARLARAGPGAAGCAKRNSSFVSSSACRLAGWPPTRPAWGPARGCCCQTGPGWPEGPAVARSAEKKNQGPPSDWLAGHPVGQGLPPGRPPGRPGLATHI